MIYAPAQRELVRYLQGRGLSEQRALQVADRGRRCYAPNGAIAFERAINGKAITRTLDRLALTHGLPQARNSVAGTRRIGHMNGVSAYS